MIKYLLALYISEEVAFNPLMADPSYVSSIVVKFPMMKYSNYIKGKIFFF